MINQNIVELEAFEKKYFSLNKAFFVRFEFKLVNHLSCTESLNIREN